MDFTLEFISILVKGVYLFLPILFFLCLVIVIVGQVAGHKENWNKFDALYWSFITGLTIGYGDIRPVKKATKILAIMIGLTGMMLTGIIVGITIEAASRSFKAHVIQTLTQ